MNGTVDTLVPPAEKSGDMASDISSQLERSQEQGVRVMEGLFAAARPGAVFGEPVVSGEYTVITASEVSAAGGFGSGRGFGPATAGETTAEGAPRQVQLAGGGGIGGGGGSSARPVATIIIGPDGVQVKPIVDVTKLAIAGITAWGAMLMMLRKMRRGGK